MVLNDGLYDLGDVFRRHGWHALARGALQKAMRSDAGVRWAVRNGRWVLGLSSDDDVYGAAAHFTLDGLADKIRTPTLVLDAKADRPAREALRRARVVGDYPMDLMSA
ncbi:hypothetical protein CDD83_6553 [Cordyceps sp. RAO-2017]|nr:hypothetical protein CDD83_6553 [Cordyceps sp. RAO-2017]